MESRTREFLNLLLWSADRLSRPTFRNLTGSFESWAYQQGWRRQATRLEQQRLLERDLASTDDRIYRLTAKGRLLALGGRDPQAHWSRGWDGHWRMVMFDVPTTRASSRARLRRYLRGRGFGCLQQSVWITPDSLEQEQQLLVGAKIDVKSLILLEAHQCAGESDAQMVAGAWDFERINARYAGLIRILADRPKAVDEGEAGGRALLRWAAVERQAWLSAVRRDPLLPERLLPSGYLGQTAWRRRIEVLGEAGQQLRTFNL